MSDPTRPYSEGALIKAIHLFNSLSRETKEFRLKYNYAIRIPQTREQALSRPDWQRPDWGPSSSVGLPVELVRTHDMVIGAVEGLVYAKEAFQQEQMRSQRLAHSLFVERENSTKLECLCSKYRAALSDRGASHWELDGMAKECGL